MTSLIEPAATARSKCRGCGERIASGVLRFGETLPNPFVDGDTTHWFHLQCAAYKRPAPFLEIAAASGAPAAAVLISAAELGVAHRRLPRVNGGERAPTGRARCRSCRELIERDVWRISLTFFEEYRFAASGFVHAACAAQYFETIDVVDRVAHFSPALDAAAQTVERSAI